MIPMSCPVERLADGQAFALQAGDDELDLLVADGAGVDDLGDVVEIDGARGAMPSQELLDDDLNDCAHEGSFCTARTGAHVFEWV